MHTSHPDQQSTRLRTIFFALPFAVALFVAPARAQTNTFPSNGNVGIGTIGPSKKLDVAGITTSTDGMRVTGSVGGNGNVALISLNTNSAGFSAFSMQKSDSSFMDIGAAGPSSTHGAIPPGTGYVYVSGNHAFQFFTNDVSRLNITGTGDVGIGIGNATPAARLDVNGDVNITGSIAVSGNIAAKYQDWAEWVTASGMMEPGTVVILNPDRPNEVIPAGRAYDTSVAGVVTAHPALILGEGKGSKAQIATSGRVKVKALATTKHPIHIGDLLVTSGTSGRAMKSEPIKIGGRTFHQPGTIIGKALEPLDAGKGEILVLLSLQ